MSEIISENEENREFHLATRDLTPRKIVAELDVRKTLLKTKQDILDEIYACAERKLCKLGKKQYLALVLSKINEFADEGDEVMLSCDGVISEKDIAESEVCKRKKLSVSKKQGKFYGGVMLIGKICGNSNNNY